MATITGTFKTASNAAIAGATVRFIPQDTPKADGNNVILDSIPVYTTESDGDLPAGITLAEGRYTVEVTTGKQVESFDIDVPTGSGTHNINTLLTEEAPNDSSTFVRRLFQSTAPNTVSNTSDTSLLGTGAGVQGLAENFFTDGKKIKFTVDGTITTTASPGTLTFRLKLPTTKLSLSFTPPASMTSAHIQIEAEALCRSAGEEGAMYYTIRASIADSTSKAVTRYYASDTDALDTTASYSVALSAQFSAASQNLTPEIVTLEAMP